MSDQKLIENPEVTPVKEMSFLDHLEVLRWMLIRSTIAILIGAVLAFSFKVILFDVILFGPSRLDFVTYKFLCQMGERLNSPNLCITELPFELISNSMQGQFSTHIWMSFIAGMILVFPYILWEVWKFISPGLYAKEKRYASAFIIISSLLFFIGVLFGYFVISPLSIQFLASYKVSDSVQNLIPLSSYFSIMKSSVLASGIMFELPIIIFFLSKIGIVTPHFLRTYRKHAIVVVLILAAIITPPDLFSQIVVTIPVLLLYEISIFISSVIYKKQQKALME